MGVDLNKRIRPGEIVVRVGANTIPCRNGPKVPLTPVIELIWPDGERDIHPRSPLRLVWSDRESSMKPGASKRYVNLGFDGTDEPWVTYRVPEKDRLLFEGLQKKWGMWFLLTSEQSDPKTTSYTVFNDGQFWPGSIYEILDKIVQHPAKKIRSNLRSAWKDAANFLKKKDKKLYAASDKSGTRIKVITKVPDVLEELGGELPWIPRQLPHWGKPTKTMHKHIVDTYLKIIRGFKDSKDNPHTNAATRREIGLMWNWMRQAKVFELSPEAFLDLYKTTDIYITETVCDLNYSDPLTGPKVPEDEIALLFKRQTEACKHLGFPKHLPFEVCWFGLGQKLGLTKFQMEHRNQPPHVLKGNSYACLGFLVTTEGEAHEVLEVTRRASGDIGYQIITHRINDDDANSIDKDGYEHRLAQVTGDGVFMAAKGWLTPVSIIPWVVLNIIQAVNDHQTTVVSAIRPDIKTASKFKKARKDLGIRKPTPPPFYTVYMKEKLIRDVVRLPTGYKRLPPGHRHDRRGTYVHHVQRGPLPMDPKLEKYLLRYRCKDGSKWRIWKENRMPRKWKKVLRKKLQPPKKAGEWVAILRFWRNGGVIGDESLPYIPSTRKATKGPLAEDRRARRKTSVEDAA